MENSDLIWWMDRMRKLVSSDAKIGVLVLQLTEELKSILFIENEMILKLTEISKIKETEKKSGLLS
jgi:hypothetical protein